MTWNCGCIGRDHPDDDHEDDSRAKQDEGKPDEYPYYVWDELAGGADTDPDDDDDDWDADVDEGDEDDDLDDSDEYDIWDELADEDADRQERQNERDHRVSLGLSDNLPDEWDGADQFVDPAPNPRPPQSLLVGGAVSASLIVVQEYFGETGADLIARIKGSPADHLLELARGLILNAAASSPFVSVDKRVRDHLGRHVHSQAASDWGAGRVDLSAPYLKHLILYSPMIALPDPLFEWAAELGYQSCFEEQLDGELAKIISSLPQIVSSLLPLEPLLRSGALILYPHPRYVNFAYGSIDYANLIVPAPGKEYETWGESFDTTFAEMTNLDKSQAWTYGPLATLITKNGPLDKSQASRIDRLRRLTSCVDASVEELNELYQLALIAVLSSSVLVSSSRPALAMAAFVSAAVTRTVELDRLQVPSTLATYRLPTLASVSLPDLIKLRGNEEVFHNVRTALMAVEAAVATRVVDEDWNGFQRAVAEISYDILRPHYDMLMRQIRRKKGLSAILGGGASLGVKLGVHGIASALAMPALGRAGGPVSSGAKVLIRRNFDIEPALIGRSILLEMAPDVDAQHF